MVHALTMIVRSKKTQYFYTCIRYDCLSGFWTRGRDHTKIETVSPPLRHNISLKIHAS